MNRLVCVLALVALPVSQALAGDPPAGTEIAGAARAALRTHCVRCHGEGKAKGGFGFVLDRDLLVRRALVVPGKPLASDLLLRIRQGEMPPGKEPRPTADEVRALERWIDAGAPSFDSSVTTQRLSEAEVAALIRADREQLGPRQRRFVRYLTLAHLARAGRSAAELQALREAAGKLLNSLSWHPRLTHPEPLGPGALVLRLDLRAYRWTAALWDRLVAEYPYRASDGDVLTIRADWFVATASHPPLYHDLLQLPTTDRALERLLFVDVPGDLRDDDVIRAGFSDSGVSQNNRLIERHDSSFGALWRSHDFASNTKRQSIFEHPLGPNAGETSFQPAGGEIIFHLPNGLFGYLLADANGRRIDKAPGEIVSDPRRPDRRVVTGLSCLACHAGGLLPKADQVRPHVEKNAAAFGPGVVAAVRATHPRKAQFNARLDEDNARYLAAVRAFGTHEADSEPVNVVTRRYEASLDLADAAAEVDLTVDEFRVLLKSGTDLSRTFGALLASGGTVSRELLEENYADLHRRALAARPHASEPTAAFAGHTGTVNCLAFAPDGRRAASGSDDGTVRVWDIATKQEVARLTAGAEVFAVAFSADGRSLVSGGADRVVRHWDVASGRELAALRGHTDVVRAVAFAPDGKRAISAGDDRALRVWDLAARHELFALGGHTAAVTAVAWSPDGRHLLSGGRDGTVRCWNVARKQQTARLDGHDGAVFCVAFAPDGGRALSGGNDRTARLWDLATSREKRCLAGHANPVVCVQFSATGHDALTGSSQHRHHDSTWRRWDLERGKEIAAAPVSEAVFGCVAFAPEGRQVLAGGPGGTLRYWQLGD